MILVYSVLSKAFKKRKIKKERKMKEFLKVITIIYLGINLIFFASSTFITMSGVNHKRHEFGYQTPLYYILYGVEIGESFGKWLVTPILKKKKRKMI